MRTCILLIQILVVVYSYGSELRLIKTSEEDLGQWIDEQRISSLLRSKIQFLDITNLSSTVKPLTNQDRIPASPKFHRSVKDQVQNIDQTRIQNFLEELTSFHNRFYNSTTGVEAGIWLKNEIEEFVAMSNYSGQVSVTNFVHNDWPQNSVIARIEGVAQPDVVVVLGAHFDSINIKDITGRAPGAWDNGGGTGVLMETFRVLLESDFIPQKSLEFQWYAAEELGKLGSLDIANAYANLGINVASMANFDGVGYYAGQESIAHVTDYTNKELTQFMRTLVDEYLDFNCVDVECGYACSDHSSFTHYGFPAAYQLEPVWSPHRHSEHDVVDHLNMTHVQEFTKLALAYAIEMS